MDKKESPMERADNLLKQIKEAAGSTKETAANVKQMYDQTKALGRFAQKVSDGFSWTNEKILQPVAGVIPFAGKALRGIQSLWNSFCYPAQPFRNSILRQARRLASTVTFGLISPPSSLAYGSFSPKRAGIFLTAAFMVAAFPLQVPYARDVSHGLIWEPPVDAVKIALNMATHGGHIRKEKLFLNGADEIDPKNNEWSLRGCEGKPNCEPEDAVYIRVKPSLVHHAWSLATKHGPFIPDNIGGVVPNTPSVCTVTSYGPRFRIFKWAQIYPYGLDVQCESPAAEGAVTPAPVVPAP